MTCFTGSKLPVAMNARRYASMVATLLCGGLGRRESGGAEGVCCARYPSHSQKIASTPIRLLLKSSSRGESSMRVSLLDPPPESAHARRAFHLRFVGEVFVASLSLAVFGNKGRGYDRLSAAASGPERGRKIS